MDELGINLSITRETTKQDEGNSRRNSTGKIFSLNSEERIPHYLRASTGSCHDHCKYGKKHELEVKARYPIKSVPRRLPTKSPNSQNSVESAVFPERKNTAVIKLKHSPDSKTLLPDTCNITKQQLSNNSIDSQNPVGSELLADRKKTSLTKLKSSSCSQPHVYAAHKTMKQEVSSSPDKLEVSSKKGSIKLKDKSFSAKHVTSSKPKSFVVKELSSSDTSGGSSALRSGDLKIGQRTGTSLKPKSLALKQMSSPESSGGLKGQRNSDVKISKRAGTPIVALKKVLLPPTTPMSPRPSLRRVASLKTQKNKTLKVVSPLKNHNKIRKAKPKQLNNDEVQEKTLYVIKIETENKPLESGQNKNCEVEPSPPLSSSSPESLSLPNPVSFSSHEGEDHESEYTMSETEDYSFSEDSEVDYRENAETLKEGDKGKPRKSGMVGSEEKDGQPLKFRRGKVVDGKFENDSPRRLKFRRGRVLGDNQNVKADAQRRRFKKRGANGDTLATEHGAEKVVLRHQDVQGKKDEKGLFNNVIEETASKLVETRKSKVKALVGAFETVISLQERKPSASSVA
ncbi:PREDICTED: uncharacterized protein LOC103330074 [Prunus mume]|uniref:Uncharacterized protein LOC103330074 n=1 Tax=Prunus mume TaxID=102107 RepID=A0ABM0NWH0_PRUMU|nr:PREDICTED: uncharacterized protein LOC103330074 [Prunus mume]XP_008230840.1 PREDICTED: uncharacterized protein LOC103330074 [Prunus mume]